MELFHTDTDYCTLTFGVFQLDQIAHVGVSPSRGLKLFGCEIIFEVFQPVWKTYLNVTDRHTDGHTTYCRITALCVASRGKNIGQQFRLDYNNMAFEQNKGRENTYLYTTYLLLSYVNFDGRQLQILLITFYWWTLKSESAWNHVNTKFNGFYSTFTNVFNVFF